MTSTHKVSSEMMDDTPILIIEGDMTSESDADIMKHYRHVREKYMPKNMIINFERTNYINSAGIATLINIIQDLTDHNGKIAMVGLSNHFQKVRISSVLPIL